MRQLIIPSPPGTGGDYLEDIQDMKDMKFNLKYIGDEDITT